MPPFAVPSFRMGGDPRASPFSHIVDGAFMSDLIDRNRALRCLNGQTLTTPELAVLDGLLPAASQAVEAYCRRLFGLVNRDERYDGQDDPTLLINHYPVAALDRVVSAPTPVLSVWNASPDVQRASVRVMADGLRLTSVESGIETIETVPFAYHATLQSLAAAISSLTTGWIAAVTHEEYLLYASIDLAACPGTWAARSSPALLRIHLDEVFDYEIDPTLGVLTRILGWPGGASHYRIVYTSGYDSIPEDVQEACAQLVAQWYWQSKRDPGLLQEVAAGDVVRRSIEGWPKSVRELLAPYRRMPRV
jgi:hypothetical protein